MLIDWFTVAAQAVNFLILVWLLKRFLYAPILNAIDAREKRMLAALAVAEAKQAEAQASMDEYARKYAELEAERVSVLKLATDDASIERQRLIDKARSDAENLRSRQQEQLQNEYLLLRDEIVTRTCAEVFAIAKKLLADLAGKSLEERFAEVFIQRLGTLDVDVQQQLASATHVRVRSAFELPERTGIENSIRKLTTAAIDYEVVPELISGIELIAHGHKIAWSAADYLSILENDVSALIKIQPGGDQNEKPAERI